jgi:glycosyltransferase involved in cell wall biosynthesis
MTGGVRVILAGTDPDRPRGGIAVAIPGYRRALEAAGLFAEFIPTYHRRSPRGRWEPALAAVPAVRRAVQRIRAAGEVPVVWGHAGAMPSMIRKAVLLAVARAAGARTVLQVHAPEAATYGRTAAGRLALRTLLKGHAFVGALTPWWRSFLAGVGVTTPLFVIPNPLPPDAERALEYVTRPPAGPPTIVTMARLESGKGVDLLIRSFARLAPPTRLVVAGTGSRGRELEALAAREGVAERVTFAGWVSGDAKEALLRSAHVFALPTTGDSFCMGLIEAMSRGVPVVALRWGAIPDVVPDGRVGWLADAPTPEAVAGALQRTLDADRDRLAEGARAWVRETYMPAVIGARFAAALRDAGIGHV